VNPLLDFGQIVVSIGLVSFILLQARGAGLSSAFGGDSSVYRSRRGIEKTLFRFTIALAVLFVIFSLIAFKLSATA
jgi:preprotein translocase subunit SecG